MRSLIKNISFRSIFQIVFSFVKSFQNEEITRYKRRIENSLQCTTSLKNKFDIDFFSKILFVLGDRNDKRATVNEYSIWYHFETLLNLQLLIYRFHSQILDTFSLFYTKVTVILTKSLHQECGHTKVTVIVKKSLH